MPPADRAVPPAAYPRRWNPRAWPPQPWRRVAPPRGGATCGARGIAPPNPPLPGPAPGAPPALRRHVPLGGPRRPRPQPARRAPHGAQPSAHRHLEGESVAWRRVVLLV